ncbi:DedA family protein [Terrabacter sp. MAHUQ-38]|uniref:DedA family protein n=1 Tax=unclassified Terrabacter TaxID=2630222 RepID=UPI00165DE8B6|nr:VTT domain-containing protein [Terrabacter sp. MAHUQ-38]MBC9820770.1 VTT domain-containing protein [Terrabacter sp. MAHUQ-38]
MLESLTDQLLALAGSPWALVLLTALCMFDALLPPVPSETVVIGLATLGAAGHGASPWLVLAVAASAAWVGDRLVFELGRRLPAARLAVHSPRVGRAVERAGRLLRERGAPFIVSARYVPTGRAGVNLAAGVTGYPSLRFAALSAVAVTLWALWSVGLGVGVGAALADEPLLAMVLGVVGGVVIGLVIEVALRRVRGRRRPRPYAASDLPLSGSAALESFGVAEPDPRR